MYQFIKLQNQLQVSQCIGNKDIPSLSGLRKNFLVDYHIAVVFLIRDLLSSFAGPYKASDTQVTSISEAIASRYYYFSLEELVYVFGKVKSGAYGNANFSGIDQSQIMSWLEAYDTGERVQIIESKRQTITKSSLSALQLKELQSLIPFEVVVGKFPECTESDYMEATIADLQTLFLPTVLANKGKESGVFYEEYLKVFPNTLPKTYLSKDSYALKIEFEKIYENAWEKAVRDLQTYGFQPQNRDIMAYLAKLNYTNYERYKSEISRLVSGLRAKRRERRKQGFANYKKTKQKAKRRFRQYTYK